VLAAINLACVLAANSLACVLAAISLACVPTAISLACVLAAINLLIRIHTRRHPANNIGIKYPPTSHGHYDPVQCIELLSAWPLDNAT
jgi:hypothetical protein